MTTEAIPFRPNMPKVDDETNPAVVDLITDCWQETSNKRPTFEDLKKRLRVINKGKYVNSQASGVLQLGSLRKSK